MDLPTVLLWGAVVALLIYIASIFNQLVRLKHNVAKAWSNIDVLLKQRHDEIPKLVQVCKQHTKYEQETLEKVMLARAKVSTARESQNMHQLGPAETALRMDMGLLFGLVENYPELKANESFQHLESRISGLEDSIADRREFYNDSVNLNNVAIEQFPDLLIALLFSFKPKDLLQFETSDLVNPDIGSFRKLS